MPLETRLVGVDFPFADQPLDLLNNSAHRAFAYSFFRESYGRNPEGSPRILGEFSDFLRLTLFPNKEVPNLEMLINKGPLNPISQNRLGSIHLQKKNYDLAEAEFKRAIELDSEFGEAYINLAYLYAKKKSYEDARIMAGLAIEKNPKDNIALGVLHELKAEMCFETGRLEDAVASFGKALEFFPDASSLYAKRAICSSRMGNNADAFSDSEKAIAANLNDPSAHYAMGIVHIGNGSYPDSLPCLEEAIRLGERSYENKLLGIIHSAKGDALQFMGKLEAAVSAYEGSLRLDPKNAEALSSLGANYNKMGKQDEAIRVLKIAIGYKPDLIRAYAHLGDSYRGLEESKNEGGFGRKALKRFRNRYSTKNARTNYETALEMFGRIPEEKRTISGYISVSRAERGLKSLGIEATTHYETEGLQRGIIKPEMLARVLGIPQS